ncbi:hypothetical protein HW555_013336 [Spodoptera exigua]|uniref:DDE Tnp4 domain-containing protein n=1 Tax=Spodoptera exigua TaxID=7107 RepID=A0A835G1Q5_SPOEX|nr:hypothetical protein HW555_013336 [Spodoptera exigua]
MKTKLFVRRQWIYPLKSHLLSPYLNPVTRGQQKYNDAHIKTRNVVERQYGVLKRRFPVLAVSIRLRLDTAIRVMLACCVLHNICIIRKECEPINDGSIPNLETLINDDQIPRPPITNSDPVYGFQRSQMTQYFDNGVTRIEYVSDDRKHTGSGAARPAKTCSYVLTATAVMLRPPNKTSDIKYRSRRRNQMCNINRKFRLIGIGVGAPRYIRNAYFSYLCVVDVELMEFVMDIHALFFASFVDPSGF